MERDPGPGASFNVQRVLPALFICLAATFISSAQAPLKNDEVSPALNIKVVLKHESLAQVLSEVTGLKEGKVGAILRKFSGSDARWVWIVKEGELPRNTNALTEWKNEGVITTLNYNRLKGATKLSVARTMIHEMIHAYLVLHFRYDPAAARDFPFIESAYRGVVPAPDLNEVHHLEMAISFVGDIAEALCEYGRSLGLTVEDSVYSDLAWGGLDFRNNDHLAEENKLRIQRRLAAELTDAPVFPVTHPAGPLMGD